MHFSLITSNVLYEPYHRSFVKNVAFMPLAERVNAFKKTFDANIFKNVDVYCFQEWPYVGTGSNEFFTALKEGIEKHIGKNNFFKMYHAVKPNPITDPLAKDSIYMLINTEKFSVITSGVVTFNESKRKPNKQQEWKRLSYAVLQHTISQKTIAIINVHVPWEPIQQTKIHDSWTLNPDYAIQLFSIWKVIDDLIVNKRLVVDGWVLCGDFNYNTWDYEHNKICNEILPPTKNIANYELLVNALKPFFNPESSTKQLEPLLQSLQFSLASNADNAVRPTSFGTAQNPVYQFNDYIFYTTNLPDAQFSIYPEDSSRLIRHGQPSSDKPWYQAQAYKDYFSDHAIVRVDFTDDIQLLTKLGELNKDLTNLADILRK